MRGAVMHCREPKNKSAEHARDRLFLLQCENENLAPDALGLFHCE